MNSIPGINQNPRILQIQLNRGTHGVSLWSDRKTINSLRVEAGAMKQKPRSRGLGITVALAR
jgi:hypothetical protein